MNRFFALSRTTHGILDLATPGFCALLWLGGFPAWQTILLSLITAFAAYTAIYALNDLAGMAVDREKLSAGINPGYSVEASGLRYPLARLLLPRRDGWLWFGTWFVLALIGCYLLNPVIDLILIAAAILEVVYCRLFKVTYLRTFVSGLVKSCGPIAAVFAVDRHPLPLLLLPVFAWVFFWEIGGQNVPADWNDTVEDRRVNAKTIPLLFGPRTAGLVVVVALVLTVLISLFLPLISPAVLGWPYVLATAIVGSFLLLIPAFRLLQIQGGRQAAKLFDNASYYPLAQLAIMAVFVMFR